MSAKSKKAATPENESSTVVNLMIVDNRLSRPYSPVEVATIAAGCEGIHPMQKVYRALDLLFAAEEAARCTSDQLLINAKRVEMPICYPSQESPEERKAFIDKQTQKLTMASLVSGILVASERHKTGRIKRSSLVLQTCQSLGVSTNQKYAEAKFMEFCNQWLKVEQKSDPSMSRETMLACFETGRSPILLKDDTAASGLAGYFGSWLQTQESNSSAPQKRKRSTATGSFSSSKTNDVPHDADGKFMKKSN